MRVSKLMRYVVGGLIASAAVGLTARAVADTEGRERPALSRRIITADSDAAQSPRSPLASASPKVG
jgi:hypothetical protein